MTTDARGRFSAWFWHGAEYRLRVESRGRPVHEQAITIGGEPLAIRVPR